MKLSSSIENKNNTTFLKPERRKEMSRKFMNLCRGCELPERKQILLMFANFHNNNIYNSFLIKSHFFF